MSAVAVHVGLAVAARSQRYALVSDGQVIQAGKRG